MATIHLLNVKPGDCTIIQHNSGRVTMMDVCCAKPRALVSKLLEKAIKTEASKRPLGNFRMCEQSTNPLTYMEDLKINSIHRFILSHPDMDHMDGLDALAARYEIVNFWDSGYRRTKPSFTNSPFEEADWDRYVAMRDGTNPGTNVMRVKAGDRFPCANVKDEDGSVDGLHILAPNEELVKDLNPDDDINEASYVVLYKSSGGKILLPGDAHDATWDFIMNTDPDSLNDCKFLLAPHHGRDSDRKYDFLDAVRPKLTLIGCAPSRHISYGEWHARDLHFITSNQAGDVVLETRGEYIDVFIENASFAEASGCDLAIRNAQGYIYYSTL